VIELSEDFRDLLIELYDGMLQIGLPPRRVDILNRADGVSFDEAVAEGSAFALEGRRIPVIGRDALIKNKRAAGRAQDVADIEALAAQSTRGGKSCGDP
jgi:hypothetical protein